MLVHAVKQKINDEYTYKIKKIIECCWQMKSMEDRIDLRYEFPERCEGPECEWEYSDERKLLAVMIHFEDMFQDTWNCTEHSFYPIKYCPFCGEKIEIVIVGEEDLSNEVNALAKKANELMIKERKSGYIKSKQQLNREIAATLEEIDKLYSIKFEE